MAIRKFLRTFICSIVTYPVDKILCSLNNWGLYDKICVSFGCKKILQVIHHGTLYNQGSVLKNQPVPLATFGNNFIAVTQKVCF